MKIGVLEVLTDSVRQSRTDRIYNGQFRRHYASITPQSISVWCRQLGHEVHYATYFGQADPRSLLPDSLDFVFLSTYTQASAVAYALGKLFRQEKTMTAIGGPHATSFPVDCLRFFDFVVHHCDKGLIRELLDGDFDRGQVVTSGAILQDIPSVEERIEEIRIAGFRNGRPMKLASVPLLTSLGCPYQCDFCVDGKNPYLLLPEDRLEKDLRYIAEKLPGIMVSYHDPNFAVKFDQILDVIERIPEMLRNPYIMECSLTVLRSSRYQRLRDSNCVYAAPGIESWGDYSNKAGAGAAVGREKLDRVVEQFEEFYEYVPGLQANFMFGTDVDAGDEPIELTKEFMMRAPYVWPTINIPIPFGGTPLFDGNLADDRIFKRMPFSFYYMPNLVTKLQNYEPIDYYDKLIDIYSFGSSPSMLLRRLTSTRRLGLKGVHALRTLSMRQILSKLRVIRDRLKNDPDFLAFYERRTEVLPDYYHEEYRARLAGYAELMTEDDMTPVLDSLPPDTSAIEMPEPGLPEALESR